MWEESPGRVWVRTDQFRQSSATARAGGAGVTQAAPQSNAVTSSSNKPLLRDPCPSRLLFQASKLEESMMTALRSERFQESEVWSPPPLASPVSVPCCHVSRNHSPGLE